MRKIKKIRFLAVGGIEPCQSTGYEPVALPLSYTASCWKNVERSSIYRVTKLVDVTFA